MRISYVRMDLSTGTIDCVRCNKSMVSLIKADLKAGRWKCPCGFGEVSGLEDWLKLLAGPVTQAGLFSPSSTALPGFFGNNKRTK